LSKDGSPDIGGSENLTRNHERAGRALVTSDSGTGVQWMRARVFCEGHGARRHRFASGGKRTPMVSTIIIRRLASSADFSARPQSACRPTGSCSASEWLRGYPHVPPRSRCAQLRPVRVSAAKMRGGVGQNRSAQAPWTLDWWVCSRRAYDEQYDGWPQRFRPPSVRYYTVSDGRVALQY
jgi:hypothetical protein